MEQKNMKAVELQDEDLEQVAGGGGFYAYKNKDEYTAAGIKIETSFWHPDELKYAGRYINFSTAAALVFYNRAVGLTGDVSDISAALDYKATHGSEYTDDVHNANS